MKSEGKVLDRIEHARMAFDSGDYFYEAAASTMLARPSEELAAELNGFHEGKIDDDFGIAFLREFLKPGIDLSETELRKYNLERDAKRMGVRAGLPVKWSDAIFYFGLTYNGEMIASLGFDPMKLTMFVSQIQGVRRASNLRQFGWPRALVSYAISWARKYGIPKVEIQSVKNNPWAKYTFKMLSQSGIYPRRLTFNQAMHLDYESEEDRRETYATIAESRFGKEGTYPALMPHQGFMLYDVTARRAGFKKTRNGNYVKNTGTT